jgi:hypothetical protein
VSERRRRSSAAAWYDRRVLDAAAPRERWTALSGWQLSLGVRTKSQAWLVSPLLSLLAGVSLLGCHGSSSTPAAPACTVVDPGPAPIRRLTRFEIGRSLADVLGLSPTLADGLPPDEESQGYDNNATAYSVSALHATDLLAMGESAAAAFAADGARLGAVAGCDPTSAADGGVCLQAFIQALGGKLWRRPLDGGETADLVALAAATGGSDQSAGVTAVVAAMLQAPGFVYRPEPTAPAGGTAPLPPYTLATRLSYLVTSTAPDDQLLAAAADGSLSTPSVLTAQTERLLATPRALESFQHFVNEWWELEPLAAIEKDTNLYRNWTPDLPAAFAQETNLFLADAWQNGPTLERLLTGTTTFADVNLASFYGYPLPSQPGFQPIALDPTRASGLLTQGSFLATHAKADQTSPVLRGRFVRALLFCTPPPPPPPDLVITPPTVDPRLSTRQRFQQHTADPFCAGCHTLMDPIGFSFEHFDATGHWRDVDGGLPVDATGSLGGTDVDGDLDGVASLAARLVKSEEVRGCVATQWFRWTFGRTEQTADDLCTISTLTSALTSAGGDMRSLIRATVKTPTFLAIRSGDAQ